jgi:tRNA threonylcarbamoyladenosine biosynthesis protein TsaE
MATKVEFLEMPLTLELADEAATLNLGARLAKAIRPGLVVFLHGDLGAGKTTLSRGLLHGAGFVGRVKSPTYTLVEPYVVAGVDLYHFDLYRLTDAEEWEAAGFREYFNADSICLVEWSEKAAEILPKPDWDIFLSVCNLGKIQARKALIVANTELGIKCLKQLPE